MQSTSRTREARTCGRFAPTPSGRMHLGNAFSSLLAWLDVRSSGGHMVLRIEDLDPRARDREHADLLMGDLRWLGLDWDEGPLFQSRRTEHYEHALCELARQGLTYPCFCTRSQLHAARAPHAADGTYLYQGTCRDLSARQIARLSAAREPAVRLRVPRSDEPLGIISYRDLVYGERKEVLADECGDFLVRRSDGVFSYQLAVVVDDALMGINHVVRGRDLLGSAARQSYLFALLGHVAPVFAHVPLLIAPDGRRLSKRDHDLDLGVLRERGVDPRRIVGRLAHAAGLAEKDEDVTPAELVGRFSWEGPLGSKRDDVVVDPSFLH